MATDGYVMPQNFVAILRMVVSGDVESCSKHWESSVLENEAKACRLLVGGEVLPGRVQHCWVLQFFIATKN